MEDYKCSVNYLSEPVDVYSEWIDACEEANKEDDWGAVRWMDFLSEFGSSYFDVIVCLLTAQRQEKVQRWEGQVYLSNCRD